MKSLSALVAGLILTSAAGITPDISRVAGQGYDRTDPRNCPPRGDPRRTACLERMVRDGQVDIDRDTAYLDSLNRSMERACAAAENADALALLLTRNPNRQVRWGGRAWSSARMLSQAALGSRRDCQRLQNELRRRR